MSIHIADTGFEIFPILYNVEKITEEVFSVPVEGMDGIVTVFAVKVGKQAEVITKKEMDERGISAKELEKIAMEENCAYTLMPLNAAANDYENDSGAFILSSRDIVFGSSVIACKKVRDSLAKRFGENLYVLPSSIHELIIIPEKEGDEVAKTLSDMVKCVNRTVLKEEDFLSDHVFLFDFKNDRFKTVA